MDKMTTEIGTTSPQRTEQRSVIKFCVKAGMTPAETWKFLNPSNGASKCSRTIVFDLHKRFRDGREEISDDQRSGRPKKRVREDVKSMILSDRRKSVDELSDIIGISHGTTHNIVSRELNMSKVCARWVPRLLTLVEKKFRVAHSTSFLRRWEQEGDSFLGRIVTTDETWISLYEPETKRESMVWKRNSSRPSKKARTSHSTKKVMFIFFLDRQGMLLQHAVPSGVTVNKDYYQKVIQRHLSAALRKKRPDVEMENLIFHQDNAPAHRAEETIRTIEFLGYEILPHAPYSPDLAPCDFSVFPRLKADIRGQRFESNEELRLAVRSAVRGYDSDFYNKTFDSWVYRHKKCLEHSGEYFEKL